MADILIRGMEMPNNVFDCPLNSFGTCNLAQDETNCDCIGNSRPEWCPLVPLPEGHGKLKDSTEIIGKIKEKYCGSCLCPPTSFNCQLCKITKVIEIIKNAPTIVPAEGGEGDA